ncbi:MAG: hypothetical protein J6A52_01850 [Bacilli bacterium]|nr:hypothetical protein [Bacilli bacterium]
MMNLPKIEFKEISLQDNIDMIKWTYFEESETMSMREYTIQCFPELKDISTNLSQSEVNKIIEEVVTKNYNESLDFLKEEAKRYNKLWKEYNDKYFKELSLYLNINWPNEIKIIEATVGILPVFPRNLDEFSFSIGIGIEDSKIIEVCAHETLHFLWFEKWKKIHPETPKEEYDSPYLVWQYSEMVTDPILNNKPFSNIFSFTEYGYDYFYDLVDNDSKVMDNLRNIYKEEITVEEKINKGFKYISHFLE